MPLELSKNLVCLYYSFVATELVLAPNNKCHSVRSRDSVTALNRAAVELLVKRWREIDAVRRVRWPRGGSGRVWARRAVVSGHTGAGPRRMGRVGGPVVVVVVRSAAV